MAPQELAVAELRACLLERLARLVVPPERFFVGAASAVEVVGLQ
jgi:hypothetical protein